MTLSKRTRIALLLVFACALILFLPLRIALGAAGLERMGVSARGVSGTIWSGHVDQLMFGVLPMGSVRAGVSPIALLTARARFDVARKRGQADDLEGAFTVGFGRVGIDDVTGAAPLGRVFAPLPLSTFEMEDVTAWFAGDRCGHGEGRVRARLAGQFPGLNLAQGLSGVVTCDGDALLIPLVSQSGLEKISLRIWRSGRYVADMRVETADPTLSAALGLAGFTAIGGAQALQVQGTL